MSHGKIASGTDRHEIREIRCPSRRLWNVVAGMEIKGGYAILAPSNRTFDFELFSGGLEPDLFSKSLGNLYFPWGRGDFDHDVFCIHIL
jgi:hypothetical protein